MNSVACPASKNLGGGRKLGGLKRGFCFFAFFFFFFDEGLTGKRSLHAQNEKQEQIGQQREGSFEMGVGRMVGETGIC